MSLARNANKQLYDDCFIFRGRTCTVRPPRVQTGNRNNYKLPPTHLDGRAIIPNFAMPHFNFDSKKPYTQKLNEFSHYLVKQPLFERPNAIQRPGSLWDATATIYKGSFGGYRLTFEAKGCVNKTDADENVCRQALEYLKHSPECLTYLVTERNLHHYTCSFQPAEGNFYCTIDFPSARIVRQASGTTEGLAFENACALVMHELWNLGYRP